MKKLFISIVLSLFAVTMFPCFSFADNNIVDGSRIKVVISGNMHMFKDTPIMVNGRTLLPLRETLTSLGVQNDDEHIKWDSQDQSVTVYKDSIIMVLKVNSNSAIVNDGVQALDVAPVNYKNRVYIPTRFVSQSLGKKILWDGTSSTIFVNDESELVDMKSLLQKSDDAMKAVKKVKFIINMNLGMQLDKSKANFSTSSSGAADLGKKFMYAHNETSTAGSRAEIDYAFLDKNQYVKDKATDTWKRLTASGMGIEDMVDSGNMSADELLCAGLTAQKSEFTEEIVLKGNTYPVELFKKAMGSYKNIKSFELKECYSEIVIDETTSLIKSMKIKINGLVQMEKIKPQMDMNIDINYTDYNGDFEINIPDLP